MSTTAPQPAQPSPAGDPTPSPTTEPTHWVLTLSCPDGPGIVHAVAGALAGLGGNITESQQFGDPLSGLFFMRVQVEAAASRETIEGALTPVADRFGMTWELDVVGRRVRTLLDGRADAGASEHVWDLRDGNGRPVSSGVYFVRLSTADASSGERVVVLR